VSFGPKAGSGHDRTPEPQTVDADAAASLYHQAFTDGQQSVTRDPQAGYDLGFDVGYGARNDHGRVFARQLMAGHDDGLAARHELAEAARSGLAASEARAAHARMDARREADQPDPQPEAEAG
jgi:hypothetical protein